MGFTQSACDELKTQQNVETTEWKRIPFSCSVPSTGTPQERAAAVGCSDDESVAAHESSEGGDWWDYIGLASVLVFLAFGGLLTISIMACCITCCGKGGDEKD